MPAKRDSEYFKGRLKREHPMHYRDLLSGHYKSINAAAIAAGLIKEPSNLLKLKQLWRKATAAERRDFMVHTGALSRSTTAPTLGGMTMALDKDKRLLPAAKERIEHVLVARKIRIGVAMSEMGFKTFDMSIASAMCGTRIHNDAIEPALVKWLNANARHWAP